MGFIPKELLPRNQSTDKPQKIQDTFKYNTVTANRTLKVGQLDPQLSHKINNLTAIQSQVQTSSNLKSKQRTVNFDRYQQLHRDDQDIRSKAIKEQLNHIRGEKDRVYLEQLSSKGIFQNRSMSPARYPDSKLNLPSDVDLNVQQRNVARTPSRKKKTAHLDRLHSEVAYQQENMQSQNKMIAEHDFDYVFFEKENYEKSAQINQINRNFAQQEQWIQNEIKKVSSSFVVAKLGENLKIEQTSNNLALNKIKWSELFLKQPKIQTLMNGYFEQLFNHLQTEFHHNMEHLENYLNYPRNQRKSNERQTAYTREIISNLDELDGGNIKGCVQNLSLKQERNISMNLNQAKIKKLQGMGGSIQKDNLGSINQVDNRSQRSRQSSQLTDDSPRIFDNTTSRISRQGEAHKFLKSIPKVIRDKNKRMLDQINTYIQEDPEARRTFYEIINNKKEMFAVKFQKLEKLNDQYENIQIAKQTKAEVLDSIEELQKQVGLIQMEGLIFNDKIQELQDNSSLGFINKAKPTLKIFKDLTIWLMKLNQRHMDELEQKKFSEELWVIASDFEKQVQQEERGWQIEKKAAQKVYQEREQMLKDHYQFHIQALESALTEVKLGADSKIEQANMSLADKESELLRLDIMTYYDDVDQFIKHEQDIFRNFKIPGLGSFNQSMEFKNRSVKNFDSVYQQIIKERQRALRKAFKEQKPQEFEQSTINKLIDNDVSEAKQEQEQKESELFLISHDQSESLNERINKYFKFIKLLMKQNKEANEEIQKQKHNFFLAIQSKNEIHEKCVKYEDLVHGISKMMVEMLLQRKFIDEDQGQRIVDDCKPYDLKITKDLNQIDMLFQKFNGLNVHQKFEDLNNKIRTMDQEIENISEVGQEIKQHSWFLRVKDQFNLAKEKNAKGAKSFKKPTNDELKVISENETFESLKSLIDSIEKIGKVKNQIDNPPYLRDSQEILDINVQNSSAGIQADIAGGKLRKKLTIDRNTDAFQKAVNSKMVKAQRRSHGRMTFFGDTCDIQIKSISKKKIYFQYDQVSELKVGAKHLKFMEDGLKDDPIARKVYLNIDDPKSDTDISSSSEDSQKQVKKQTKERMAQFNLNSEEQLASPTLLPPKKKTHLNRSASPKDSRVNSYTSMNSSDDIEEKRDFDDIIKEINRSIQQIFKQIQTQQFPKTTTKCCEHDDQIKQKMSQKILPIDCIRIEPYMPPQINLIPIKLLMLKNESEQALDIIQKVLRAIASLFTFSGIEHLYQEHKFYKAINMEQNLTKNKSAQCQFDNNEAYFRINSFSQFKSKLNELIFEIIKQDLDKKSKPLSPKQKKLGNTSPLSSPQQSICIFTIMKDALLDCTTEQQFMQNLKGKFEEELKQFKQDVIDQSNKDFGFRQSIQQRLGIGIKNQNKQAMQSLQEKLALSDESDNQNIADGPDENALRPQFSENERKLDEVKEQAYEDTINAQGGSKTKVHLDAGKIDIGPEEEQFSPYIKLARQDDLIKKSLMQMNNELKIKNFEYQTKRNMLDPRRRSFMSGRASSTSSHNMANKKVNLDMQGQDLIDTAKLSQEPIMNLQSPPKKEVIQVDQQTCMSIQTIERMDLSSTLQKQELLSQRLIVDQIINSKPSSMKDVLTEITMDDIEMIMQFKRRAICKMQSLEEQIQDLKFQIKARDEKLRKQKQKSNGAFVMLPKRPESAFVWPMNKMKNQEFYQSQNQLNQTNFDIEKLKNNLQNFGDEDANSLRAVPPGFFMLPNFLIKQPSFSDMLVSRNPSIPNLNVLHKLKNRTISSPYIKTMDYDTEMSPKMNQENSKSIYSKEKRRATQIQSLSSKEVATKDRTNSEAFKSLKSHSKGFVDPKQKEQESPKSIKMNPNNSKKSFDFRRRSQTNQRKPLLQKKNASEKRQVEVFKSQNRKLSSQKGSNLGQQLPKKQAAKQRDNKLNIISNKSIENNDKKPKPLVLNNHDNSIESIGEVDDTKEGFQHFTNANKFSDDGSQCLEETESAHVTGNISNIGDTDKGKISYDRLNLQNMAELNPVNSEAILHNSNQIININQKLMTSDGHLSLAQLKQFQNEIFDIDSFKLQNENEQMSQTVKNKHQTRFRNLKNFSEETESIQHSKFTTKQTNFAGNRPSSAASNNFQYLVRPQSSTDTKASKNFGGRRLIESRNNANLVSGLFQNIKKYENSFINTPSNQSKAQRRNLKTNQTSNFQLTSNFHDRNEIFFLDKSVKVMGSKDQYYDQKRSSTQLINGASHDQIKITDMYKPDISMFQQDQSEKQKLINESVSKLKNFNEFKNHQRNLLMMSKDSKIQKHKTAEGKRYQYVKTDQFTSSQFLQNISQQQSKKNAYQTQQAQSKETLERSQINFKTKPQETVKRGIASSGYGANIQDFSKTKAARVFKSEVAFRINQDN